MAVKDSGEIATNSNYALGDYSFRIERSSVPGSTNDKIEAICTDKDGKNARKSIQIPSSTQMSGWYVEANSDTADVYAVVKVQSGDSGHTSDLDVSPASQPIETVGYVEWEGAQPEFGNKYASGPISAFSRLRSGTDFGAVYIVGASASSGGSYIYGRVGETPTTVNMNHTFTYNGKTVYYNGTSIQPCNSVAGQQIYGGVENKYGQIAWTMIYGNAVDPEYEDKEMLVARFAIELEDAGGVGPESDWNDPGDYDEDREEGDPTHTLYVTVTGALSGRHNDPIEDPNYSYIPADKDTVKDYGCGGDGGNGGGGGAGASTVVVHKFATNQANSKEVTAIARRHGYGSGGGKGGKGGDGCILVYY